MKQETATVSHVEDCNQLSSAARRIASFVVLDLETNDLPHVFSKIAITELCMYGFAASELETGEVTLMSNACGSPLPKRPRILHKLTLLFNPRQLIHPSAENITGLSNYSLEKETHFDENAGIAVINFIKHMQQPVCLVAHNGDVFDFPVIKQSLQKLNMEMPEGTLCLDSLRAFWGIDEQLPLEPLYCVDASTSNDCQPNPDTDTLPMLDFDVPDKAHSTLDSKQLPLEASSSVDASTSNDWQPKPETDTLPILDFDVPDEAHGTLDSKQSLEAQLNIDEKVNWQVLNEKTPKRSTVAGAKKRPSSDETTPKRILSNGNDIFKSKRGLFTSKPTRKYPPKGVYKLGNLYERHFKEQPKEVHYAEADVESLMNLMKVYGINFLAFAENHAILLNDIKIRR